METTPGSQGCRADSGCLTKDAMSVVIARPSSSIELAMSLENNASVTISHRERHHFVVDVEVFPLSVVV